jgi:hypothetical protein
MVEASHAVPTRTDEKMVCALIASLNRLMTEDLTSSCSQMFYVMTMSSIARGFFVIFAVPKLSCLVYR